MGLNSWKNYLRDTQTIKFVEAIITGYDLDIKVTKSRKTKLGDYKAPFKEYDHRITVNDNLNCYTFLLTLVHEIAHMLTYDKFSFRVKSHGREWKAIYASLLTDCIQLNLFPDDISDCLKETEIKASAHGNLKLAKLLKSYDKGAESVLVVEQLKEFSMFEYNGRIFKLESKLRKRYKCLEVSTNKAYLFSPLAEVLLVENS